MATNYSTLHLGKRPRRHDVRTLKMARYLTGALPAAPARVDYTHGITDWGMMMNDQLGCCTIAAVGHAVQAWTANALGRELTVPDSAILASYEKWDGYNPADPSTDQGGVELDVLNDWRQQGFDGQMLDAFVAIELGSRGSGYGTPDPGNSAPNPQPLIPNPIAQAIWLFGGAYIGVELPISAQDQDVWDIPAKPCQKDDPGSWGGHAVYLVGYDLQEPGLAITGSGLGTANSASLIPNSGPHVPCTVSRSATFESLVPGPESRTPSPEPRVSSPEPQIPSPGSRTLTCITWGKPKKMTWAWFEKYCSEAYALVSKDWLESSGVSPSGFDLATLENDLKWVTA